MSHSKCMLSASVSCTCLCAAMHNQSPTACSRRQAAHTMCNQSCLALRSQPLSAAKQGVLWLTDRGQSSTPAHTTAVFRDRCMTACIHRHCYIIQQASKAGAASLPSLGVRKVLLRPDSNLQKWQMLSDELAAGWPACITCHHGGKLSGSSKPCKVASLGLQVTYHGLLVTHCAQIVCIFKDLAHSLLNIRTPHAL